jgi:hypothetical protein
MSRLNYTRTFLYKAVKLDYHYPERIEITKEITVSEELLAVDKGVVMEELHRRAVYELKEEIVKWMMDHDDSCQTLQRILDYGLR